MLTFDEAKEIFETEYPNYSIISALDVGDEFVMSAGDKESGEPLDISPFAINKDNGKIRTFFPPANVEKLKDATTIEL
jgi:hypothetical protein